MLRLEFLFKVLFCYLESYWLQDLHKAWWPKLCYQVNMFNIKLQKRRDEVTHHLRACPMRAISLDGGTTVTSFARLWAICALRLSFAIPPYTSLQAGDFWWWVRRLLNSCKTPATCNTPKNPKWGISHCKACLVFNVGEFRNRLLVKSRWS